MYGDALDLKRFVPALQLVRNLRLSLVLMFLYVSDLLKCPGL